MRERAIARGQLLGLSARGFHREPSDVLLESTVEEMRRR
jgi:hypothetical protein